MTAVEDEHVDGAEPAPEVEEKRRYPSTIGGAFYLGVLTATVVGLVVVWGGNWRSGSRWFAVALIAAAVLRLVLPRRDAGMLAVRHRVFDVVLTAGLGVAMLVLAGSIPDGPGL